MEFVSIQQGSREIFNRKALILPFLKFDRARKGPLARAQGDRFYLSPAHSPNDQAVTATGGRCINIYGTLNGESPYRLSILRNVNVPCFGCHVACHFKGEALSHVTSLLKDMLHGKKLNVAQ